MNTFKHKEYFDYEVRGARSNNCVLINAQNWLANTSNEIIGVNSRGGIANNYITQVLDVNIEDEKYVDTLSAGDVVMLTSVASRLYTSRTFTIPIEMDTTNYTDIPVSHIVGKFANNDISFPSFKVLANYVMLEVIDGVDSASGFVKTADKTKTICKVVKFGPQVTDLKEDDVVLIRDNIATVTTLNGKQYSIVSEDMIVGIFNETSFTRPLREVLTLRHNFLFMEEYQPEMTSEGSLLALPQYDASKDEGMSMVYSENTYKVLLSNIADILPDDLVYISRAATEYVTCLGQRYYVALDSTHVIATIRGEV